MKHRRDDNHAEIAQAFRRLGWTVHDTSQVGGGFPDLVVANGGVNLLVEVKDGAKPPSARKLTPAEQEFHARWRGRVVVIKSVDDVVRICEGVGDD